jgi:ankyrin repeat protein
VNGVIRLLSGLALAGAAACACAQSIPDADARISFDKANSAQQIPAQRSAGADGMTALHWAAYNDDTELAKKLVAEGADSTAQTMFGIQPLYLACLNGNAELTKLFLSKGANPNLSLRGGETVLMTAARTGIPEAAQALIDAGADVNAKARKGQSALMWAAAAGNTETVQLLIKAGADLAAPLESGFTPFLFAVREGHLPTARVFINAGADVKAVMKTRRTGGKNVRPGTSALMLAVENGHFDLAEMLLESGADPNDQRSGFAPLHALTWVRKPNRGDGDDGDPPPTGSGTMDSLEFARKLVKHGADPNLRLAAGKGGRGQLAREVMPPFMLACATADLPYMDLLLALGADPAIGNKDGATSLMAAAGLGTIAPSEEAGTEQEAIAAIELLLGKGLDINAVDGNGETAMHGAAYKSFPKVVELLAKRGAKTEIWNIKNKWGWTPLNIAEGHRPGNFKPSFETIAAIEKAVGNSNASPSSQAAP